MCSTPKQHWNMYAIPVSDGMVVLAPYGKKDAESLYSIQFLLFSLFILGFISADFFNIICMCECINDVR